MTTKKSIFFANLLLFVGVVLDSISVLRMAEVLPDLQTEISDKENEFFSLKALTIYHRKEFDSHPPRLLHNLEIYAIQELVFGSYI